MRKSVVLGLATVFCVMAATIATGQSGDTLEATSKVGSGGTKKKPRNVTGSYSVRINGPDANTRAETGTQLDQEWVGLIENGRYFPTCTSAEIDAAQSDAACPPGSVVGTGRLEAKIGPTADRSQSQLCTRTIKVYNEGKGKLNIFSAGDPADCLGIPYFSPVPGTAKRVGNKLRISIPIPENIQSPLPGVSGYFSLIEVKFSNAKVKGAKGKKVTILQSVGCGKAKNREFKFTAFEESGPLSATASAGKC